MDASKLSTVFVSGLMLAGATVSGCSSGNFGAKAAAPVESASPTTTTAAADKPASDGAAPAAAKATPASAPVSPSGAKTSAFQAALTPASPADQATVGCVLPAAVQNLMAGDVAQTTPPSPAMALTSSWGGGNQSGLNLKHLDLNSCQWFKDAQGSANPQYLIVFTNATQSYAQPFTLSANLVSYATCLGQAAVASIAAGGSVTCTFMPTN